MNVKTFSSSRHLPKNKLRRQRKIEALIIGFCHLMWKNIFRHMLSRVRKHVIYDTGKHSTNNHGIHDHTIIFNEFSSEAMLR